MAFQGNFTTNTFLTGLPSGLFNFNTGTTDVYKIALYTNAATLNASTTAYTSTGEVTNAGYTTGGQILTINQVPTTGPSGSVSYWSFGNVSWAGAITARGALIYKYNGTTNPAVCVLDFGNDKTSAGTFTVQFPAATSTTAIIRLG